MTQPVTPVHVVDFVYFGPDREMNSAEVCLTCSDSERGRWVPVSFCPNPKIDWAWTQRDLMEPDPMEDL